MHLNNVEINQSYRIAMMATQADIIDTEHNRSNGHINADYQMLSK